MITIDGRRIRTTVEMSGNVLQVETASGPIFAPVPFLDDHELDCQRLPRPRKVRLVSVRQAHKVLRDVDGSGVAAASNSLSTQ